MKRHVLALFVLALVLAPLVAAEAAKKYKLTVGNQSIVVELEEIQEPTPAPEPEPEPEPLPEPEPEPEPTPDPEPTPEPTPSLALNLQRLKDGGWKVPFDELPEHPTPEAIKSSIIPPFQTEGGIVSKRLWIPRKFEGDNYDPVLLPKLTGGNIARCCLKAWYELDVKGNQAGFTDSMSAAKALWHKEMDQYISGKPFSGILYVSTTKRDLFQAILTFDWIVWADVEEYEAAYQKIRLVLDRAYQGYENAGHNFAKNDRFDTEGYFNANTILEGPICYYALLALSTYGVNPSGESHAFADDWIDRMPLNPFEDSRAVFSPWHFRDCLSLISLGSGGGREWGAFEGGPSMGGYEFQWSLASVWFLPAAETATGGTWNFLDNDYFKTRWIGLAAIEDKTVEKTSFHLHCKGAIDIMARLMRGSVGKHYAWLAERDKNHGKIYSTIELQAIAGCPPVPEAPQGEFFERVGSRLYYKRDLAEPDSTFRFYWHYRNIDNHREIGEDRASGYAIGKVGLVSGHANRAMPMSVLANGIGFHRKSSAGDPMVSGSPEFWGNSLQDAIYHSPLRAAMPKDMLSDPRYLKGSQDGLEKIDGVYHLTRDWTETSAFERAVTRYTFNPTTQTITIEDEVKVDATNHYLGWHFSPNLTPVMEADGFSFGDGVNQIRVTITANVPLIPKVRQSFQCDGYTLPLEWHSMPNGGSLNRIAANVGYTPAETAETYQVTTTIEAK